MIRIFISLFFVCILNQIVIGQSAGDYRSAVTTGDSNLVTTWQTFDGNAWVAASEPPNNLSGVITIQSGHTITFYSEVIDQLVVNGVLKIATSNVMSFPASVTGDAVTVNGTLENLGTITMTASSVIRMTTANGGVGTFIARPTSVINSASSTNLFFDVGSTYQHAFTTTAGTIPLASWNKTSTCLIKGYTTNSSSPANFGQTFGNVTFDLVANGSTPFNVGGSLTTVKGTLSTASTNARIINLSSSNYTLSIDGDLVSGNNVLQVAPASGNNANIIIKGDLKYNLGTIRSQGSGSATIFFSGTGQQNLVNPTHRGFVAINFEVSSGSILDLGVSSLNGVGTFKLNSGATLQLGSPDTSGALTTGTAGNIRVTGARTYISGSTIIYNGATAQYMGNDHPAGSGITTIIDNAAGVTLAVTPLTINGSLTLLDGDFNISGRTLTLGGVFTPNTRSLLADVGTNLTINDVGSTADFGLLKISGTSVIGNFTLSGTVGRTVKLGADFAVGSQFNQANGDLQLNGYTLNIQGAILQSGGTLTSSATSGLNISNETGGSLPPNLVISGGSINTITMNRLGETLTTSSNLTVNNIDLVVGTFTHTGILNMATNGKISVSTGFLTYPVTAVSTYNVEYYGTDDVSTGAELPISATILNNLSNLKTATVNLSAAATVNGALILNDGFFYSNSHQLTLNGNFVSNGASDFSAAPFICNGNTIISGSIVPQFGDLTVNSTKSLALSTASQINVGGNFTMNGNFTSSQSKVTFNNSLSQIITGSNPISFYQLEIDKTANQVTIQSSVDIQDVLNIKTPTTLNAGANLLRLLSSSTRTARVNPLPNLANILGSVIVQRYLPYGAAAVSSYRYLTPSVTNTFVSDWQVETPITGTFSDPSTGSDLSPASPSLFYYDETVGGTLNGRYKNYPASGSASVATLTNGLGYALFVLSSSPIVLDSRGTLAQHQKSIGVTAQSPSGNDGWNLIGNPYPSPVLWSKVTLTGTVNNAIYIRDNTNIGNQGEGGLVTYINGVSVPQGFNGVIDTGQAFWVHANGAGTVTFNETDKITSTDSTGQFYRERADSDILRLFVNGTNGNDELVIRFSDQATDNFDSEFDALKLPNDDLNLSSRSAEGRDMTINTLAQLDCSREIGLTMSNVKIGNHTLRITGIESFGGDVNFILKDQLTGNFIDLRNTGEYSFQISNGDLDAIATRFVLEIGKTRILKTLPVSSVEVCTGNAIASLVVSDTQPEVDYQMFFRNQPVTDLVRGNGSNVTFAISTKTLNAGTNLFTVLARNGCTSDSLQNKALIKKAGELKIENAMDALVCRTGSATFMASGAKNDEVYNWYNAIGDAEPFKVSQEGKLIIEQPQMGVSYYVSIKNTLGCESERKKVTTNLVQYEDVFITEVDDVLVSNYKDGNKWFFNGTYIDGESTNKLKVSNSGVYSVKVNISGCTAESTITKVITAINESNEVDFTIFPNPTPDEFLIRFGTEIKGTIDVIVTSSSGVQLYNRQIELDGIEYIHKISLGAAPQGLYIIRIKSGEKIISKRIIKI